MHVHLEVLVPPTDNPVDDVETLLKPFDESAEDEEGYSRYTFWDWWVIGGRWSCSHLLADIGKGRMDKFVEEMPKYKVSGVQTAGGLYEVPVEPDGVRDELLELWKVHFPEYAEQCPFWGLTDQYDRGGRPNDIVPAGSISKSLTCSQLLIGWRPKETIRPLLMLQDDFYNGVSWQDSAWDGKVLASIEAHNEKTRARKDGAREGWWEEYGSRQVVGEDWLAVTVDYHT